MQAAQNDSQILVTLITAVFSNLPATLMAAAAFITAAVAAWKSIGAKAVAVETKAIATDIKTTTDATHGLINSRFDEWKKETMASTAAATVAASVAASTAATAAHKAGFEAGVAAAAATKATSDAGIALGKAEAEVKAEEIARALATPVPKKD